jgi:HD-GYP domain-containing protein (c-di-GMP phosphodiesterase class II)
VAGGSPHDSEATGRRQRLARQLAELLDRIDAKEGHAHRHANRVAALADAVADRLGVARDERATLQLGAYVHDIGKLGVPGGILRKPGALTAAEWAVVRRHSEEGVRLLGPIVRAAAMLVPEPRSRAVLSIVRWHHERWDGRGYPDGAAGDSIALGARIVAVCDAYEAMTEARSYRPALSGEAALEELLRHAGTQFDPRCADALVAVATEAGGALGHPAGLAA